MLDKQKTIVKGTIRMFKLAGWVNEDAKINYNGIVKVLDLCREFVKTGDMKIYWFLKRHKILLDYKKQTNLIATVGRAVLAERLAGGATYSGEINYGALGDDNTAPTNADVALGNEVYRKLVSSQTFDDNIAYIDFFYTASDTNGTYEEFGNFIDGAAGADTGQLWSHILTGGWTKSNTESLFVSCQYTLT